MIIAHENQEYESNVIAEAIKEVYELESKIINSNFDNEFKPTSQNDKFNTSSYNLRVRLDKEFMNKSVMVITQRDIYASSNLEDGWWLGY